MSKKSSKFSKLVPTIFELLEKGLYCQQIAVKLGIPYSTMNYWLHRLEAKGFLESPFRSSFKAYKVRQKTISLVGNEKLKIHERKVYRRHFLGFSFRILKDARIPFDREINLRNNKQWFWRLKRFNASVRKTSRNLTVHLRPKAGLEPRELFLDGYREALDIRYWLLQHFPSLELSEEPVQYGKEHYGVGDELGTTFHKEKKVFRNKRLHIDDSDKSGGEVDWLGVEVADAYSRMPDRIKSMEEKVDVVLELVKGGVSAQQSFRQLASMIVNLQEQVLDLQRNRKK